MDIQKRLDGIITRIDKIEKLLTDYKIRRIDDLIDRIGRLEKLVSEAKKTTGRGNINTGELEKCKQYFRRHPEGVLPFELAEAIGVSQARAGRLIDLLSGDAGDNENTETKFLVYADEEETPVKYFIFKDEE